MPADAPTRSAPTTSTTPMRQRSGMTPAPESSPLPLPMPRQGREQPGGMPMAPRGGSRSMGGMDMSRGAAETATAGPVRLPAVTSGMTLEQLESIALHSNPTMVQAQAQVDASLAKSVQAGLFPNPIVGYVSEQIGAGGAPGAGGSRTLGLGETQGGFIEQEIMRGGKLRLSRAKYQQEAVQAEMQVRAQQMRVVNGIRMRYYDVLAAWQLVAIERELLENHNELVRTLREMANVGQANRPDVLQAQVAMQRQRVSLRAAENRLRKSWQGLVAMAGAPHLPLSGVAGDLERDMPTIDFEDALGRIIRYSPELQVARAEVRRDEITVQRERVQPIPNAFVRVETGYNWEVNLTTVGVQCGWNLPVFNRNQGTIREAMAEVTRARAEVARLELSLRERLAEVFARYQTALATALTYRAETLPQAREAYQLNLSGFRERRTPWAQVVLSQRTFSDLLEEYIETLLELRHTEVEINGLLLVGGLAMPEPPTPGGHIDATPQPR
jgi:cobalt-zinc-cadmium efflux system outer membrane protein